MEKGLQLEMAVAMYKNNMQNFKNEKDSTKQKEFLENMYKAMEIFQQVYDKETHQQRKQKLKTVLTDKIEEIAVYNAQYELNLSMIKEQKTLDELKLKKVQQIQMEEQNPSQVLNKLKSPPIKNKSDKIQKQQEPRKPRIISQDMGCKNQEILKKPQTPNNPNNRRDDKKPPLLFNKNNQNKPQEEKKEQEKPKIPQKQVNNQQNQAPKKQFLQKGKNGQPIKDQKPPPEITFEQIAGLRNAKNALKQAVILPLQHPEIFVGNRKPWKGILLYGPPGTGKTLLAKACAGEINAHFFGITSSDITSKWLGETEKNIKQIFEDARKQKPSIIFVDECEALFGARKENSQEHTLRALSEFLQQMQGVGNNNDQVLIFAATNLPFHIDSAIRRRFEKRIYIPLPDQEAREALLKISLSKDNHNLNDEQISNIATKLDGYSCSDIDTVIKGAAMQPLMVLENVKKFKKIEIDNKEKFVPVREQSFIGLDQYIIEGGLSKIKGEIALPPICFNDFIYSIQQNKPSVSHDQLQQYEQFTQEFGMDG